MAQTFLTAEWRKLIMANYAIDPAILAPYLPNHTKLDFYNGNCYVSLVGFMFQNTRLKGFHFPLHINFQEVNLRFYVLYTTEQGEVKRGVVFIRELVPKGALTFVANNFYGEHYATVPMRHKWHRSKAGLVVNYRWKQNGWQKMQVVANPDSHKIPAGSEAEFITEHYWGYTKLRNNRTSEYEVVHPVWDIYPVERYEIAIDFKKVYGDDFECLHDLEPTSIFLAEGSEVTVRSGSKIRIK